MGEYLFIGSAILSLANGTVLLCVNPRRVVNRAFFASSVCITAWCFCVIMAKRAGSETPLDLEILFFWIRASSGVGAFLVWFTWLMRSVLLENRQTTQSVLVHSLPWFCTSCLIATLAFSESFIPSTSTPENTTRGYGYVLYVVLISACCLWLLFDSLRQSRRLKGARRIEMQFFVVSALCACLLVVTCNAVGVLLDMPWLRQTGSVWFSILHGIAVWAVCYYRVFDAKKILVSIGQRLSLFSFLGLAAVLTSYLLKPATTGPNSVFIAAVFICVLVIICDRPMRRWLGLDAAHVLLSPRRKITEWARELPDEEKLKIKFEGLLREWCQTSSVAFLSARDGAFHGARLNIPGNWPGLNPISKDNWTTPEALQRAKPVAGTQECAEFMHRNNLGALLAAPKESPFPSLLVALGQKESLRPYAFPDIQMLLELAELMDNILTHSRVAAHAAQIERMETASMMSRGLAHDLSNLATPVATFLTHMGKRVVPGTTEAQVLADAKHSIGVMQKYIQESLFFSRALTLKIEPIEASQLMTSVARLCHDRARIHDVEIEVKSGENFIFWADPALMQRLMQNLIFNAIDASPRKGRIELSASSATSSWVVFKVHDYGSGIPPGMTDRIFEPYFTTKQSGSTLRGLGLGLAICRKITDLHSGSISVACDENRGTVFTVTLPEKQDGPAIAPVSQAAGEAHIGTDLRPVVQSI